MDTLGASTWSRGSFNCPALRACDPLLSPTLRLLEPLCLSSHTRRRGSHVWKLHANLPLPALSLAKTDG